MTERNKVNFKCGKLRKCTILAKTVYFVGLWIYIFDGLQVWMPDTFFRNEKDGKFHDIIQPNLYVRVFPDGDILYSIRLQTFILCMVSQNCKAKGRTRFLLRLPALWKSHVKKVIHKYHCQIYDTNFRLRPILI